jgi:hypothetical protein
VKLIAPDAQLATSSVLGKAARPHPSPDGIWMDFSDCGGPLDGEVRDIGCGPGSHLLQDRAEHLIHRGPDLLPDESPVSGVKLRIAPCVV